MGAAPSWPAAEPQSCQGTSAEPPEPQHDPGSPQTPPGAHHSLESQTEVFKEYIKAKLAKNTGTNNVT